MTKATFLAHTLLAGISLSFVGAKGCLGGNVSLGSDASLGDDGTFAGNAGMSGNLAASAGKPPSTSASSGSSGAIDAPAKPSEAPLIIGDNGLLNAPDFGVSGPLYALSDGFGLNGDSASGDCELAGHAASECAQMAFTNSGPPSFICARGTVEKLLDVVGNPGTPDYGAMWGAGVAFNFVQGEAGRLPYDASAHGVIGIAFDIDRVPQRGLRVEILPATTPSEPAAWKASQSPSLTSPVQAGRNIVLFQDATPLPFYNNQSALDPTQILSVQFHLPTTNVAADFDFCISNLSLVLGTPPARPPANNEGCSDSLTPSHGFAYDPSSACLSPHATKIGCYASGPLAEVPGIPSSPAIAHLPCVRRLSDDALFLALNSSTGPLAWQTLPESAWPRLPASEWAECTANEAALLEAAAVCTVLPF